MVGGPAVNADVAYEPATSQYTIFHHFIPSFYALFPLRDWPKNPHVEQLF